MKVEKMKVEKVMNNVIIKICFLVFFSLNLLGCSTFYRDGKVLECDMRWQGYENCKALGGKNCADRYEIKHYRKCTKSLGFE
jgi:hypothetical protein